MSSDLRFLSDEVNHFLPGLVQTAAEAEAVNEARVLMESMNQFADTPNIVTHGGVG